MDKDLVDLGVPFAAKRRSLGVDYARFARYSRIAVASTTSSTATREYSRTVIVGGGGIDAKKPS